jgi:hypothetical protein
MFCMLCIVLHYHRNHWATTNEDEGVSCDVEIMGHVGLYWVFYDWTIEW